MKKTVVAEMKNVVTLAELKATYMKYFLQYKRSKELEQLNALYIDQFDEVKEVNAKKNGEIYTKPTKETAGYFLNCINTLKGIEGLELEMNGSWLWVKGDTKANKEALKNAGCWFAPKKKMWYLAPMRG
jgi:hypothetical protein